MIRSNGIFCRLGSAHRKAVALAASLVLSVAVVAPSRALADTCTINVGDEKQVIDGFGFSDGWSGTLSSAKNNALYNTLGMSILRCFIYADGVKTDDITNAAAARAAGATVFATGWPQTSWKLSNSHLDPAHYQDYANWLASGAQTLGGVSYISPMNEPNLNTASCQWTSTEIQTFIRDYAPSIGTPIMFPECFNFDDNWSDPTLNDSVACNNVSILAGHFYGDGNYVHQNALNKGKHVWETEHCITDSQTSMPACITLAKEVSDAMNNSFSGYCWWWVRDSVTDGTNLVNSDGTIYKNGYTLGQFAKWVRPGKVRCNTTYNPNTNIYVTAYHKGGVVIVAVNTGSSSVDQAFAIQNAVGINGFLAYRTSSSENMAALGSTGVYANTFTYTLPPQSVTTFTQDFSAGPSNGTYKIISQNSGLAMDAQGQGTGNGTQIQQWTYWGGPNQKWTVTNRGGWYSIIGVQSGKSVDIDWESSTNWGTNNGTQVRLWDYWGGTPQQFTFADCGGGYYRITPNCATSSCLDVQGIRTDNGAQVWLWQWLNGANQKWSFQAP